MDEPRFEFSVTYVLNSGREVLGSVGAKETLDAIRVVEASLDDEQPRIVIKINNDKSTALSKAFIEQFTVELVYEYTRIPGMERQKGGPKPWSGD